MSELTSNRRNLVILFGVGFVPLIIAWVVFFYFPDLMPRGTTNEGELLTPQVQANELGLPVGKWSLLIPVTGICDARCEERLFLARQVKVALGKETERVQRLMVTGGVPESELSRVALLFPDMQIIQTDQVKLTELLKRLDDVYLMDPIGNIFMVYSIDKAGKPMLKDIKHLLKISNIG